MEDVYLSEGKDYIAIKVLNYGHNHDSSFITIFHIVKICGQIELIFCKGFYSSEKH